MDEVCQQLDLAENDYFGLRYVDIEKQRVSDQLPCNAAHSQHFLFTKFYTLPLCTTA